MQSKAWQDPLIESALKISMYASISAQGFPISATAYYNHPPAERKFATQFQCHVCQLLLQKYGSTNAHEVTSKTYTFDNPWKPRCLINCLDNYVATFASARDAQNLSQKRPGKKRQQSCKRIHVISWCLSKVNLRSA